MRVLVGQLVQALQILTLLASLPQAAAAGVVARRPEVESPLDLAQPRALLAGEPGRFLERRDGGIEVAPRPREGAAGVGALARDAQRRECRPGQRVDLRRRLLELAA